MKYEINQYDKKENEKERKKQTAKKKKEMMNLIFKMFYITKEKIYLNEHQEVIKIISQLFKHLEKELVKFPKCLKH